MFEAIKKFSFILAFNLMSKTKTKTKNIYFTPEKKGYNINKIRQMW